MEPIKSNRQLLKEREDQKKKWCPKSFAPGGIVRIQTLDELLSFESSLKELSKTRALPPDDCPTCEYPVSKVLKKIKTLNGGHTPFTIVVLRGQCFDRYSGMNPDFWKVYLIKDSESEKSLGTFLEDASDWVKYEAPKHKEIQKLRAERDKFYAKQTKQ